MARKKPLDAFEKVVAAKKWPEMRDEMYDMSCNGLSKGFIGERLLKVDRATFYSLCSKHKELQDVFDEADKVVCKDLMAALTRAGKGMHVVKIRTHVETIEGGKKKKVVDKDEYDAPPDTKAAIYVLKHRGGRDFYENKEELDLAEKKMENGEVWPNGNKNNL